MRRVAATSSYTVDLRRSRPAAVPDPQPEGRVPRVARLLALAHKIDGMVHTGELHDLADAARVCNATRPRMTQIMNLTLLAPGIQEAILHLPPITKGRDPITERTLRSIAQEPEWARQQRLWNDGCDWRHELK